ncbi:MAG: biopolymer transporter ExbD [Bryobacterales bacterium]|jgi:biopolymer transport protein ExbD|nr:biopolymer transporter ExbD [Bryobacterales bacterium]
MSEINIIPLVDVVLVLLIIFMLTAHVMEFGLEVDVPRVDDQRASAEELPVVTINKTGEIFLNEKPANINALGQDVRKRFQNAKAVYVRADKETIWDPIAQVVNILGKEKIEVRMVTQPLDKSPARR